MKPARILLLSISALIVSACAAYAANVWPKEIPLKNGGKVIIYQPQPESLSGNMLKSRAAVAVKRSEKADPVFGVVWSEAQLETDRDTRMATLANITITDARFPDEMPAEKMDSLKQFLAREILKWNLEISLDELATSLDEENKSSDDQLGTQPPTILYSDQPATLISFDGDPMVKKDEKMNMERVQNTPALIVKSPEDGSYYLYGEKIWYRSSALKDGWAVAEKLPSSISGLDQQIKKQEKESKDTAKAPSPAPVILTATAPSELVQTNGEAKFAPIENTGLLYVTNSDNNLFMDVTGQQYYVLFSGRWYRSASLKGPWEYIPSDKLPGDFAKIPEGSDKDEVLASVAGTNAARDAVMDAQIPQTAKVDRKTATTKVTYDGDPKFEKIEGTSLQLAVNSPQTVIRSGDKYYTVDNGVWFVANSANGPWAVSDERPSDVDKIPAKSAAYNVKYVYIYDSTPDVVYVGYTPGYTGCFVYGPTVVYGTGYYYAPWYGAYYYPRPVTWGFGFHYNPYTGWGMTVGVNFGMVSVHFGGYGCYYGPPHYHPYYRPPYYGHYPPHYHGGYYGPRTSVNVNQVNINNNNFYKNRTGMTTRDNRPAGGTRPSTGGQRPSTQPVNKMARPSTNTPNNVISDRQGNVYKQNAAGGFDQRNKGSWQSTSPSTNPNVGNVQRDSQSRQRSSTRQNNYQN